jgi:hypothetical protein
VTALLERPTPAADVPRRSAPTLSRAALWTLPPLLIVLVAAVYPLIRVCLESTKVDDTQQGWSTWSGVLASEMFRDALWRTVAIAATSTAGCLVLSTFLAIVLAFVPFPGAPLIGRLIDTVLALPSFLITLAFTFLYGTADTPRPRCAERACLRATHRGKSTLCARSRAAVTGWTARRASAFRPRGEHVAASVRKMPARHGVSPADTHARGWGDPLLQQGIARQAENPLGDGVPRDL